MDPEDSPSETEKRETDSASRPPRWVMPPSVRGALLLFFVLANFAEGCPLAPNIQARHLNNPVGQRELARWGERLRGWGMEISDAELAERTLETSATAQRWRAELLWPVQPYFDALQIRQRWSLFPVAKPRPMWMHIEGRGEDGAWRLLYRPLERALLSEELADRLEYRRMRAHWNPGTSGPRPDYTRFVDWLAATLFLDDPELVEVRVRYRPRPVPPVNLEGDDAPFEEWSFEERRQR